MKYPIINFFYSFMKLSFPISTFNAHTYFFAKSEKRLHENKQKTLRTTKIYLTTEKIKPKRSENSSFSNAKLQHPKFGVTFGQQSQAKTDIMGFAA